MYYDNDLKKNYEYINNEIEKMKLGLSPEQYQLLHDLNFFIHKSNDKVYVFSGGPGTGKSFIIGLFAKLMVDCGIRYVGASYTGQAVNNMKSKGINNAYTLHTIMIRQTSSSNRISKMPKYDVCLLDEASMIPINIIDKNGTSYPTRQLLDNLAYKTIIFGDQDQLGPIKSEAYIDLAETAKIRLSANFRQKDVSDILDIANMWLNNKYNDAIEYSKRSSSVDIEYCNPSNIENEIINIYNYFINHKCVDPLNFTILTSTRYLSRFANNKIRSHLGYGNYIVDNEPIIYRKNNRRIKPSNNPTMYITNGTRGKAFNFFIINKKNSSITLITDNDDYYENLKINIPMLMNTLDEKELIDDKDLECTFGYSSTIHISQGKEYDYGLIIITPDMMANDLMYVALTRFKKYVKVLILNRR